jgi:hypothetical protein
MFITRHRAKFVPVAFIAAGLLLCAALCTCGAADAQSEAKAARSSPPDGQPASGHYVSSLARGTKLILKNGSYELAREYDIEGNRVRYYSVEDGQWDVIPASLVDWEATKKEQAEEEKSQSALLSKVKKQENEHSAAQSLDIDASLEVARGVFLPPGVGLFAFDGKSVLQVPQAQTDSQLSKTRFLERVIVPVPIIPSRHIITIPGAHSKFRLNGQPEFYLRTTDARTPDVELIRAKVHHGERQIMNLDQLMGEQHTTSDSIPVQQWVVAKGVYRYTLGEKLPRGEYVVAEILPNEGMSLYVWDFGVN